jgi:hypothetical protein
MEMSALFVSMRIVLPPRDRAVRNMAGFAIQFGLEGRHND